MLTETSRSTTDRLEVTGEKAMQKIQDLQNQALCANAQMLELVRDMHRMMLGSSASQQAISPHTPTALIPSASIVATSSAIAASVAAFQKSTEQSRAVSRVNSAGSDGKCATSMPAFTVAYDVVPGFPHKTLKRSCKPQLPTSVESINRQRQQIGSANFQAFHLPHQSNQAAQSEQVGSISSWSRKSPSLEQLGAGLDEIFGPAPMPVMGRAVVDLDEKKRDFISWIHELDHFLGSCASSSDGQASSD